MVGKRAALVVSCFCLVALSAALAPMPAAGVTGTVFVPVTPCRVVDTRLSAAGPLLPGAPRQIDALGPAKDFSGQGGSATGCGIPFTATAVMFNFVAVGPAGPGNLRAWASGPAPNASVINYVAQVTVANGVIVPIDTDGTAGDDLIVRADVSGTHLVIDVLGYQHEGTQASNTALGEEALGAITVATSNTAFGDSALAANTDGHQNTAVGALALRYNTSGDENTAVGLSALLTSAGSDNTAVGSRAMAGEVVGVTGSGNTAVGASALYGNTYAGGNTAVGSAALSHNSFANGNTAWASSNTAVGSYALYWLDPTAADNGYLNTAVGADAMVLTSTGESNSSLGYRTMYSNTTGSWNVALGAEALYSNQTGTGNVAIGHRAGYSETGSDKLYIGNGLGTLVYGDFSSSRLAVDATDPATTLDVNGSIRSRALAAGSVCATATGVLAGCPSDARLKTAVRDLATELDVLAALGRLRGVLFEWDGGVARARDLGDGGVELGLLAQEVEAVLPQVVGVDREGYRTIEYGRLVAFLVEVAKAQQRQIEAQREQIGQLTRLLDEHLRRAAASTGTSSP